MKMRNVAIILSAFILAFGLCGTAGAFTVDYSFAVDANGGYTTAHTVGVTVQDFNSSISGWSGSFSLVSGSLADEYAAPTGPGGTADTTQYIVVPTVGQFTPDSATSPVLGSSLNYFGIWWGSADSYNSISFYKAGNLVLTVTASDVFASTVTDPNDSGLPQFNKYVNFNGLDYDQVSFSSSERAFEFDNIAYGNITSVPEPATLLYLGCGLIGLGVFRRKLNII